MRLKLLEDFIKACKQKNIKNMKPYRFLIVVMFMTFSASTSFGADWKLIGKSASGSTFYVDTSTIRCNFGMISAWIKEAYDKPHHGNNGDVVKAIYNRETLINTRSWHIAIGAKYSQGGEEIEKIKDFSSKPSTPDTIEETITNFLIDYCTKQKK